MIFVVSDVNVLFSSACSLLFKWLAVAFHKVVSCDDVLYFLSITGLGFGSVSVCWRKECMLIFYNCAMTVPIILELVWESIR